MTVYSTLDTAERVKTLSRFFHRSLDSVLKQRQDDHAGSVQSCLIEHKNRYLKNIDHLCCSARDFYQKGHIVPAYLMTRSALEQVAFLNLLYDYFRSRKWEMGSETDEPAANTSRLYFSTQPGKRLDLLLSKKNCRKAIQNLDRTVHGIFWQYQALNDVLRQKSDQSSNEGDQLEAYHQQVGMTMLFNLITIAIAINDDFVDLIDRSREEQPSHPHKIAC